MQEVTPRRQEMKRRLYRGNPSDALKTPDPLPFTFCSGGSFALFTDGSLPMVKREPTRIGEVKAQSRREHRRYGNPDSDKDYGALQCVEPSNEDPGRNIYDISACHNLKAAEFIN
jgi:hypothetical protein